MSPLYRRRHLDTRTGRKQTNLYLNIAAQYRRARAFSSSFSSATRTVPAYTHTRTRYYHYSYYYYIIILVRSFGRSTYTPFSRLLRYRQLPCPSPSVAVANIPQPFHHRHQHDIVVVVVVVDSPRSRVHPRPAPYFTIVVIYSFHKFRRPHMFIVVMPYVYTCAYIYTLHHLT